MKYLFIIKSKIDCISGVYGQVKNPNIDLPKQEVIYFKNIVGKF